MEISNIKQVTNNKFLNYFECDVKYNSGKNGKYFFASRNSESDLAVNNVCDNVADVPKNAVTIAGTLDDKIVLIKQSRVPVGDSIYECPAGLIEKGESPEEAARREIKEETGFEIVGNVFVTNSAFTSPGMTDETNCFAFCELAGEPSTDKNEDSEEIEVFVCDKDEVRRILSEEKISSTCQAVLMMYMGMMANCGGER